MAGRWRVLEGDAAVVVPTIPVQFDFIFADPPFNIGEDYIGFEDNRTPAEYGVWTADWIRACWAKCRGVMCLHGPDSLASMYLLAAHVTPNMRRIAWVNWHYRFGQCNRNNWIDARCHCLIFAKSDKYTWNPEEVLVDSDRVAYGDKRVAETERGGKRLPGTVWGVPSDGPNWGRVQGNNKERREGHPNQLPEVYLERLIRAYTNPGDNILDPFCGSGTTATVGVALGRNVVTVELVPATAASARARIAAGPIRVQHG